MVSKIVGRMVVSKWQTKGLPGSGGMKGVRRPTLLPQCLSGPGPSQDDACAAGSCVQPQYLGGSGPRFGVFISEVGVGTTHRSHHITCDVRVAVSVQADC